MKRDEVARNQRARIYGGMIESIARRGYHATTVAHVIALAGVSRRAFYEQFPNKLECFLATHDIVVAGERKRVIDAWTNERGWANRTHASAKRLLDDVAETPKGPHLVLVDALGIGRHARERMLTAAFTFERLVESVFAAAPDGVSLTPVMPRAIVGGVRHLAFTRLRAGRQKQLLLLTDEVLDWIEAYRSPAAARVAAYWPPSGRRVTPVPAEFLTGESRRARSLGSVVHLTLDCGYAGLTDPQIAQFAGISTEAFHKQFSTREECYLTVLDEFVAESIEFVGAALEPSDDWAESVYRGIDAFIEHLAAHQALLRIAFVDVFEVGPAMVGRLVAPVEALTQLLLSCAPLPKRGPAIVHEVVTGAIWAVIFGSVGHDRIGRLPYLVDQLAFITLAPYLGPRHAADAIARAREQARRG